MLENQLTCKNCGNTFIGKYCNSCGEKVYTQHDKTVAHLAEEGMHFITHFEGAFLVTLRTILTHPGQLSLDYCNGIRKKYFKPLSFFLLLIVIYLIFPLFRGLNMDLKDHMSNGIYGGYATSKIKHVIAEKNWTLQETTVKFHAISEKVSKFLLFIIIPVMSLLNWAILRKRNKLFFDHFIFATETASLFVLWGFLLLPLVVLVLAKIALPLGGGFLFEGEALSGLLLLIPFFFYIRKGLKRFYNLSRLFSSLYALLYMTVFTLFILIAYKFLQFVISILFIH